jgi:PKD repeat protein
MKNKISIKLFKSILITFALVLSFSAVDAHAQLGTVTSGLSVAGGECNTDADCDIAAGYLCKDGECTYVSLEQGGTGLSIPTGDVKINKDIVQTRTFGDLVITIVNYFVGFLGFIAVIFFVYAGVLWVVSGGNEESITKAKKIMIYASIGLIVVILSYSIVRFITSSAGEGCDPACTDGQVCNLDTATDKYICVTPEGGGSVTPTEDGCMSSGDCAIGEWCSSAGICVPGTDISCESNDDCALPTICDIYGFCRNPNANADTSCSANTDCPSHYVCNLDTKKCEVGGTGTGGGAEGGPSEAATSESLDKLDSLVDDLVNLLDGINDEINGLPAGAKDDVLGILNAGTLADKISGIDTLINETEDPAVLAVLERIKDALDKLNDFRTEMDKMREVMPESEDTIKAWDETSTYLNDLIDDPTSGIKLRRFEKKYRTLRELISKFPVVVSKINAAPAEGNVPFTVTFDGMDSIDPTGGTISDYKWSYVDATGNTISLGDSPVITHEFTEPNTYSVKLQVSGAQKDTAGYKTAVDGISYVRIKASPPASKVDFKINGADVTDVHHVTMKEAQAGLSFDPATTVPALGRVIEKYEWFYGDSSTEERTTPTTVVHSYQKPGEYYVTLKVTDNHDVTDKKVVKLFVKSVAADIEINPSEGNVNTEFRFRGVDSRSDDGTIRDYEWQVKGPDGNVIVESTEDNFYHQFESPGKYDIILVVTDSTGAKDKYLKVLDVFSRTPIASFSYTTPESNHPNRVQFSALNSYDPDQGDRIKYSWDFNGDGDYDIVNSGDIEVTHEYEKVGEYKVTLQVEDSFGQRSQIQKGINIDSVLSGDIVLAKYAAQVGDEVSFKADSPNAVAYLWEFGDGETTNTEEKDAKHVYNKKGKYKVKLNFFDDNDNSNSDIAYMLIGDRDMPVAFAKASINGRDQGTVEDLCGSGKNGIVVTRADSVFLSAKDSINTDGSSRMLSYDWRMADGTRSSNKEFVHKFDEINREGECFSVSLAVRDQISGKMSDEDILYFKVTNQLPTITDFVIDAERGKELVTPTKVKLRVVNPKDPDGQIKKYRWWYYQEGRQEQKLGVHSTSAPETEMVITAEGQPDAVNRYYFVLEIADNDNGIFNTDERFGELSYLDVKNGPNLSPVAEFTLDKTTISVGDSVTFLSQSYDPQGDQLPNDAFRWDFDGDGEFDDVTSGPQVNRQYNTPGEYEVRLKVVYRGLSSSISKTIFVEQVDSLPQAAFTYEINGTVVKFDASNSRYDPSLADKTLRYEWDFDITKDANGNGINDDDVESTEINPSNTYPGIDMYKVRLKVKDSLGMEGVVVRDVNLAISAIEKEKGTYRSLKINSPNQAITSLQVIINSTEIEKGGTADVNVVVLNADNSPYYGQVFFEVIEGSGEFSPNPVDAKDSKASSMFTGVDSGVVRIKIRAVGTYFGEVTEEAIIKVK